MVSAPAPVIDTSDMDPELARYLNRNYWQQKSVELKTSATQPSAPSIATDVKMSTAGGAGGGLSSSAPMQTVSTAGRDDEVIQRCPCFCSYYSGPVMCTGDGFGHCWGRNGEFCVSE